MDQRNRWHEARIKFLDQLTANPLLELNNEELKKLAEELGCSITELIQKAHEKHDSMTCPLCGQPSSFMLACQGCGYGPEFIEVFGEDAISNMRHALKDGLGNTSNHDGILHGEIIPLWTAEQLDHAINNAYRGELGCHVCDKCYRALTYLTFYKCPLQIHGLIALRQGIPLGWVQSLSLDTDLSDENMVEQVLFDHFAEALGLWVHAWNTEADPVIREQIMAWRSIILLNIRHIKPEGE